MTTKAQTIEDLAASIQPGLLVRTKEQEASSGNIQKMIRIVDIKEGQISPKAALRELRLPTDMDTGRFVVQVGDILVARQGGDPKVALVNSTHAGCLAGHGLVVIRAEGTVERGRIYDHLTSDAGQATLRALRRGVSMPSMPMAELVRVEIP